jgi:2-oxoglutarate dehydrogenase dihydrolipoamide succinyltransferase (E2 component)
MSTVDVVMPQMGVSVSEGTVSRWMKAVGETIEKDETLLEISTDKVDTEVPSPASGVVTEILAQEGDTLDVGARLAVIATEAGAAAPAAAPEPAPVQAAAPAPAAPSAPAVPASAPTPAPVAPAVMPAAVNGNGTAAPGRFVSPVVARIAAEHGVDVNAVPGSGAGGRVTKKDIMSFLASGGAAAPVAAAPATTVSAMPAVAAVAAVPAVSTPAPAAAPAPVFTGGEQVINFNPMRKAIARHMTESKVTSAHVTSTIEVDMTNVVRMRGQVKGELLTQWGVKVTFTHFVIRALIDAVAHYPMINSEIRGDSAVIKHYLNLGVAVALDGGEGLIVPVVKNAEEKNLVGIARSVNDLADRARSKRLGPDDVVGGTFTLTNPGVFGTIHGTPIINQPQVAILDTEAIVKRPWVITDAQGNDSIAIRSIMNVAMSYDHRLIDGAYAAQFLAHLRRNLETWDYARFLG